MHWAELKEESESGQATLLQLSANSTDPTRALRAALRVAPSRPPSSIENAPKSYSSAAAHTKTFSTLTIYYCTSLHARRT